MALSVRSNVLVTKISTNVRYLHNYLPWKCRIYSRIFEQLPFRFRYLHFISISNFLQATIRNSVLTRYSV